LLEGARDCGNIFISKTMTKTNEISDTYFLIDILLYSITSRINNAAAHSDLPYAKTVRIKKNKARAIVAAFEYLF
jgi:hypothetical protein